jgi:hypothetical protein
MSYRAFGGGSSRRDDAIKAGKPGQGNLQDDLAGTARHAEQPFGRLNSRGMAADLHEDR